jgi:hypothetical protein
MKHFLSGLWILTTISGVGCAVGSSADLGTDALPTTPSGDGLGDAKTGSEPVAVVSDGGASDAADASTSKGDASVKDASVVVAESGVDSSVPVTCAFSGELVSFDLKLTTGAPATVAASTKGPGVTVSALRRVGLSPTSSSGAINASGWPTGALDPNRHFAFSVTPPAGCKLSVTALTVDLEASASGPTQASVGTSADGYAHLESVALSAAGATNVPLVGVSGVSGPVEVHVYGFAADAAGGTLRIQNTLSLTGALGN